MSYIGDLSEINALWIGNAYDVMEILVYNCGRDGATWSQAVLE